MHPDYSGKGVGRQLVDFIADYGRENGVKAVRLDVYRKMSRQSVCTRNAVSSILILWIWGMEVRAGQVCTVSKLFMKNKHCPGLCKETRRYVSGGFVINMETALSGNSLYNEQLISGMDSSEASSLISLI